MYRGKGGREGEREGGRREGGIGGIERYSSHIRRPRVLIRSHASSMPSLFHAITPHISSLPRILPWFPSPSFPPARRPYQMLAHFPHCLSLPTPRSPSCFPHSAQIRRMPSRV